MNGKNLSAGARRSSPPVQRAAQRVAGGVTRTAMNIIAGLEFDQTEDHRFGAQRSSVAEMKET
jgi:hypothetical protein